MMRVRIVVALLLCTPTALAWASQGESEPSTRYDVPSLMWSTAPTSSRQVYFNAVSLVGAGGTGPGVNPNVATLGSRNEPVGAETHIALLGVWVDCNGDGYIGLADGAMQEYPSDVLSLAGPNAACPPSSGGANSWDGSHNYNGWVTELVPIGNREARASDLRLIQDPEAAVWGDFGRPSPVQESCGGGPGDSLLRVIDCAAESSHETLAEEHLDVLVSGLPRIEPPSPKHSADWNFHFLTGSRGGFPSSVVYPGRTGGDDHLGLLGQDSRWMADSFAVKPTPRTVRGSLDTPMDEGRWLTFFAHVGSAARDRGLILPGGTGVYGAEACGGGESGTRNGWECDAAKWNVDSAGAPLPTQDRTLARPGLPFELRDVDCHDGGNGLGIGTGVPFYGERPCSAG